MIKKTNTMEQFQQSIGLMYNLDGVITIHTILRGMHDLNS